MDSVNGFENIPMDDRESGAPLLDNRVSVLNDSKDEKIRRQKFKKFAWIMAGISFVVVVVIGVFAIWSFVKSDSSDKKFEEIENQIAALIQKVYFV